MTSGRSSPGEAVSESALAAGGKGRRVLVIEDDRDTAEVMRYALGLKGYEVHSVFDGLEGIEAARRLQPDAVLCDVGLTGVDGYQVALALKTSGCSATLIALTGYTAPGDVARALAVGFHYHLAKPVDIATLARLLESLPSGGAGRSGRGVTT